MTESNQPDQTAKFKTRVKDFALDYFDSCRSSSPETLNEDRWEILRDGLIDRTDYPARYLLEKAKQLVPSRILDEASSKIQLRGAHYTTPATIRIVVEASCGDQYVYMPITVSESTRGRRLSRRGGRRNESGIVRPLLPLKELFTSPPSRSPTERLFDPTTDQTGSHTPLRNAIETAVRDFSDRLTSAERLIAIETSAIERIRRSLFDQTLNPKGEFWQEVCKAFPAGSTEFEARLEETGVVSALDYTEKDNIGEVTNTTLRVEITVDSSGHGTETFSKIVEVSTEKDPSCHNAAEGR